MHIVIAGGSGFIGQALTKHFLSKHHQVTIITRDPRHVHQAVQIASWGAISALGPVDAVINLAGDNLFSGIFTKAKKERLLASRLSTTQQLVDWIKTFKKPVTFICASGMTIYPPADNVVYTEETPIATHNNGFMFKLAKEWEAVANQAQSSNCRVINLRLAVVLDPSGGMLKNLLPVYRFLSGMIMGKGNQFFPWVALSDVINVIDFILKNPSIKGPINVVAPELLTQKEFAKTLAAHFGRGCFIRLPAGFLKLCFQDLADELMLKGPEVDCMKLKQLQYRFECPGLKEFLNKSIN